MHAPLIHLLDKLRKIFFHNLSNNAKWALPHVKCPLACFLFYVLMTDVYFVLGAISFDARFFGANDRKILF